jgi:hypothetical protein
VEIVDESPRPDPVDEGSDHAPTADHGPATDGGASADDHDGVDGVPAPDRTTAGDPTAGAEPEYADGKDPLRFNNWMKRSATGAVLTGITIGLQRALEDPRKQPPFVIVASDEPGDPDGPIDLRFDPDSPADTVAVIRRPATGEGGEAQPPSS